MHIHVAYKMMVNVLFQELLRNLIWLQ
jgi:hypothetical protein